MGIESQYLGEINIPEEHRAEYAQQALKLLRAGGMVTVEPVESYTDTSCICSLRRNWTRTERPSATTIIWAKTAVSSGVSTQKTVGSAAARSLETATIQRSLPCTF